MNPLLRRLLWATLLASATLALWPESQESADAGLVQAVRAPVRAPTTAAVAAPASATPAPPAPVVDAPASATRPMAEARPAGWQRSADWTVDWPEPSALALRAWQAQGGPVAGGVVPPVTRASAPAPPSAPPLPYQWLGVLDDGQGPQALLAGRHRSVALRVGQTLDRDWRLDSLAAGQLALTWLPGEQRVTLNLNTSPRAVPPAQNPATEPK